MWGTMPDVIDRACGYYADRVAVIDGERRLTYREMRALSDRLGNALVALGVQPGERIGLMRFGSRMDVFVPPEVHLDVQAGDKTVAGETVIAHWPPAAGRVAP